MKLRVDLAPDASAELARTVAREISYAAGAVGEEARNPKTGFRSDGERDEAKATARRLWAAASELRWFVSYWWEPPR